MSLRRVFVHGAGRRGTDAWPHADPASGDFLSFPSETTIDEQAELLRRDYASARPLVFAHSIGAVPVVHAVHDMQAAGVVLVEPALYDIARGDAAIERHIGAVCKARAQAAAGNLRGSWGILRPLMFGGPFDASRWEEERPIAERWATTNLPWGHGIRPDALRGIPSLIITGGWNAEYERIAALLVAQGAEHVVLEGAQHRPQDLPGFAPAVAAFEARIG